MGRGRSEGENTDTLLARRTDLSTAEVETAREQLKQALLRLEQPRPMIAPPRSVPVWLEKQVYGRELTRLERNSLVAEAEGATISAERGLELVLAAKTALEERGLVRTSKMTGGEISGLVRRSHRGSHGFAVWDEGDTLEFHMVVGGRSAGLHYHEYVEYRGDGDTIELAEPENPEIAFGAIRQAFESIGLTVQDVRCSGWSLHWDDDVTYTVICAHPGK